MTSWNLTYTGLDPEKEKLRETLCTLGNGYFATRGACAENGADSIHYPGTYLAGGYNRLKTEIAGKIIENEDLVNLPNWLPLSFRMNGGEWFHIESVEILSYEQKLNIRSGILCRVIHFRDQQGRKTVLMNRRVVHMGNPHLAGQETVIRAENWSGEIEFLTALDGKVINGGVPRYQSLSNRHLDPLCEEEINKESILLKVQTNQSELRIAEAARTQIFKNGDFVNPERYCIKEPGYIGQTFSMEMAEGDEIRLEKIVSLYTSRDKGMSECGCQAKIAVVEADSFEEILKSHALAWEHLWHRFEIDYYPADPQKGKRTSRILRLYTFHLLQTTSRHSMDLDVGVPSRGWHGEAYRGHIFWDEIFIFPMLNFRMPEITRSLLMYRYRRLDKARKAAQELGHRGAMYPWQSGSSGREETQKLHLNPKSGRWNPDNSHLQRHVNAALAYNIWQYYQVTEDLEFLSFYGAEMFIEIARFWASKTTFNKEIGRYEILGIMGPDEYHDAYPGANEPGLNNNSYTNIMTVWILNRALEIWNLLPETDRNPLCEKIGFSEEEREHWKNIARKMKIVFHKDGILSQFEGYEQLEEFDWEEYKKKYGNIQRLDRILEAEGDSPNRYKVSKQADVLMLFYLFSAEELRSIFKQLGYAFKYETIPQNINYYLKRTSHGSTLSRVVHSWVLARSNRSGSWELFLEALESDVADIQGGTTPEGIHLGAMAGTVDILQRAYTGIEARGGILYFNPAIPPELGELHMHIRYRSYPMEITITPEKLTIKTFPSPKGYIKIAFRSKTKKIKVDCGEILEFKI
ncbi:MAG: glycosyl hydrolase family 65 protein [Aminobacterium colombiense]|jgi:alpha,alpha-trehalase|uniref:Glycoside hydrolase family 65 central catalytic n=3 Tax=Aminobacterium TaxID=81466 RepID=D5EFN2_AMICL|nr:MULTISPECIES: glycosyl hydrolase family 65 protein [Aminobacterium]ADE57364.1 glycoside hydrolase family 65 central catalytic [Aminobacterium colombiense DSM 12261]MDD2379404.1 glycosyl hydrolase family 65 protein [Aminobacterium colombiense]MDD4265897.1 glycosyl hydrolase family 65 protein [Aminobacterium colombiense]MDD4586295.1 glycosyl hydrolase family 65 protein [Aminobacterium colombiense]